MGITQRSTDFIENTVLKKYVDKKQKIRTGLWIIKSQRKKCTFNKILEFQAIKKITKKEKNKNFFRKQSFFFSHFVI